MHKHLAIVPWSAHQLLGLTALSVLCCLPASAAPSCQEDMQRMADRAMTLQREALAQQRDAEQHAQRYRVEVTTCEMARKSKSQTELQACVALLDKAEARAQRGNERAEKVNTERAALQVDLDQHNRRCPKLQVRLLER